MGVFCWDFFFWGAGAGVSGGGGWIVQAFLLFGSAFVLWFNLNVVVLLTVLGFGLASVMFSLVLSSGLSLALGGMVS